MGKYRKQRTICKSVSLSGVGIHSGCSATLRLHPQGENSGIHFKRIDLPDQPIIAVTCENVSATERSTTVGQGTATVQTVEHLLSAIRASSIDNLLIEIDGSEPPIGDGSARVFLELVQKAGVQEQETEKPIYTLDRPVYWSEGEIHLVALPSDEYRISYTLSYPTVPFLNGQYHSVAITEDSFKEEIASCRTFALYEEVTALKKLGLIKGGGLDNAVVIQGDQVMNEGGLRFPNEMARHKILDLVGDLSLVGEDFLAHVIAIRSGHRSNVEFAKLLREQIGIGLCVEVGV